MDVLTLSRLQFAVATYFHFLFVPLTLGLSLLVAIMETQFVRHGDPDYLRMAKFWGKLFLINFAIGIVTGITLEFQFGTNWSRYAAYVGDIFGSLLAWPDTANERNTVQTLSVPGALSLMAGYSADTEVRGLRDFPADQRPPVLPVFLSFRLMVGLGILFLAVSLYAFLKRHSIEDQPGFLKLLPWLIPLPYLANTLGWTIAELGRQPWIVYGLLRTSDALSKVVQADAVLTSLILFTILYVLLFILFIFLLNDKIHHGPEHEEHPGEPHPFTPPETLKEPRA